MAYATTLGILALFYFTSISSFLPGGDSGELIVNALQLTTPHPPGYPIYVFLAHWFTQIPFATAAWRLGLFSALTQILAATLVFLYVRKWLRRDAIAAWAALAFSLAPWTYQYAIEAEVFALNNLLAIVFLYCVLRQWFLLAGLTLGLGFAHHLTLPLMALPIVALCFYQQRAATLKAVGPFLLGLLPYGFLLVTNNHRDALTGWGDLSTVEGFWTHVTRQEYGTFRLAIASKEDASWWIKMGIFGRELIRQTWGLPLVLAVLPGIQAWRQRRLSTEVLALSAAFVFYVLVLQSLGNLDLRQPLYLGIQERFWILPLLLLYLLAAKGLTCLPERLGQLALILAFTLTGVLAIKSWTYYQSSSRDFLETVGRSILSPAETGAVVMTNEDWELNVLRYLQAEKQIRPDVHVLPVDLLSRPWLRRILSRQLPKFKIPLPFELKTTLQANQSQFVIYLPRLTREEVQWLLPLYDTMPMGFATRLRNIPREIQDVQEESASFLNLQLPKRQNLRPESWDAYLVRSHDEVKIEMAKYLVEYAHERMPWIQSAVNLLESVALESVEYRPLAKKHLGYLYSTLSPGNTQLETAAREAWEEYLSSHPPEGEETSQIRESVKALRAQGR